MRSGTYPFMGFEIPIDLMWKTGLGPDNFASISATHSAQVQKWTPILPHHRVVEIGCGIGRDAIPLTALLTRGLYLGIDVLPDSIEWCQQAISPAFPNFSFQHMDVCSSLYNPAGTIEPTQVHIPLDDSTVDRIFLFSVFTHMLRPEIERYLGEFRRLLADGGLVYTTTFIYNDDVLASARINKDSTPWSLTFAHEYEKGCRINDTEVPLQGVAYSRESWEDMVTRSGLVLRRFLPGGWSGFYTNPEDGQDAVVLSV
jgi:SAM-dependent methyltransferase